MADIEGGGGGGHKKGGKPRGKKNEHTGRFYPNGGLRISPYYVFYAYHLHE